MTLNVSDTITTFLAPVPPVAFPNISLLQTVLLKAAVTTGSPTLAATRLLSLLFDLEISAVFLQSVTPPDFSAPDSGTLAATAAVGDIVAQLNFYDNFIRLAVSEAKSFLPAPTASLLYEYSAEGAPLYRTGVAIFLVLAVNLVGAQV